MTNRVPPTTDADMIAAERRLRAALDDPEVAEPLADVLRHLGSFTFDPVGTLTED